MSNLIHILKKSLTNNNNENETEEFKIGDCFTNDFGDLIILVCKSFYNKYIIRICYPDELVHCEVDKYYLENLKFKEHIQLK